MVELCQKWPELDADSLVEFYKEIKLNRKLQIKWTNPGRIDPNLLTRSSNVEIDMDKQFDDDLNVKQEPSEHLINCIKPIPCVVFDDNEEDEQNIKIFEIEQEAKRGVRINKTACFDKIFNDLVKNHEINNHQFDYRSFSENKQEDSNIIEEMDVNDDDDGN